MKRISATAAARGFSDLLNRVRYQGVSFEIARGNEVVARVLPAAPPPGVRMSELDQRLADLPRLDPDDAKDFQEQLRQIRSEATPPDSPWQ